jgi:putative ABC transport system permease protein
MFGIFGVQYETGPEYGAVFNSASPDYFRTMGTPVISGREFTAAEKFGATPAIIVNEGFVRQTGRAADLIGKKVKTSFLGDWRTIVGVAGTARMSFSDRMSILEAQIYLPFEQYTPMAATFVARVRGDVQAYLPACRAVLQSVDLQVPVYDVMTLDARLSEYLAKPRFYTTAILFLAGFALLLAIIGTFGVASHSIAQRTHEIGVRMAVGASTPGLRGMLLRQHMIPVAAGVIVGVAGAFGLSRFLRHLMEDASPVDTLTCGLAALILVAAAIMAVWAASGRILRIDPMNALRAE